MDDDVVVLDFEDDGVLAVEHDDHYDLFVDDDTDVVVVEIPVDGVICADVDGNLNDVADVYTQNEE